MFFNYKFPAPQYLGAKFSHLSWLSKFIPAGVKVAIDGFAGSQSVSYFFKQLGFETHTNDFLSFNHQIGCALVANRKVKLEISDLEILLSSAPNKSGFTLFEEVYSDVFFERAEANFLDNFRANIENLECQVKRAIALTVINRSMTRKITMGHFAHTRALVYAANPERIKRNRSLVRPIDEIFRELLVEYNAAVFDNKKQNISYNADILELLPQIDKADLIYFDPPYCDSHADYQGFYHLLETYTEYWREKSFVNTIKRYEPQRVSGFDKKRHVISSFNKLFELSEKIPNWLISYNDRSYPKTEELVKIVSKYRNVTVEAKTYNNSRGGKGSVSGSNEILLICKPKKVHNLGSIAKV